jgi:signal transduction histidine kinase
MPRCGGLGTGRTQSKVGDPQRPDNRFDDGTRLLDVYEPITTPTGRRLIVQACRRLASVSADSRELLSAFTPFLVGGVLLLQLVNLPLALRLTRRVRTARRREHELLQRAVAASDRERRRLASDLHNGVVQDLAGMSMRRSAAARSPSRRTCPPASTCLPTTRRSSSASCRRRSATSSATPGASRVELDDHELLVHVADDGRGFDPLGEPQPDGHVGLAMMRDLVEDAGGELAVASAPGAGTVVRARVPQ